jgi:hypothetical protein
MRKRIPLSSCTLYAQAIMKEFYAHSIEGKPPAEWTGLRITS